LIQGLKVLSLRLADLHCEGRARGGCNDVALSQAIETRGKTIRSFQARPTAHVLNDGYEPTVPGESVGFQVTGGVAGGMSPGHQL